MMDRNLTGSGICSYGPAPVALEPDDDPPPF
jgi:hypothetical protein